MQKRRWRAKKSIESLELLRKTAVRAGEGNRVQHKRDLGGHLHESSGKRRLFFWPLGRRVGWRSCNDRRTSRLFRRGGGTGSFVLHEWRLAEHLHQSSSGKWQRVWLCSDGHWQRPSSDRRAL